MIRILLCGSIPPDWGGASAGGVASFHRIFIEELLARGRDYGIEIAGLFPFNLDPTSTRRPPVAEVFQSTDKADEVRFYTEMLRATRADVVVFQHIAHRWAGYHGGHAGAIPALGVVHSWHSLTFRSGEEAGRVRRTIERALPACDRLVFVSEHSRAEGQRLGFVYPAAPVVINNPVQPIFMHDPPVVAEDRRGWVFVGSLVDRKNPVATLKAAASCGAHLAFLGEGSQEAELRAETIRLGVRDRVSFLGLASAEQVRDRLQAAELMCLPSHSESFSMAYLEALACGTPLVGARANLEELAERLEMPCGAGVEHGSVEEIIAGVRSVQTTDWDRHELRRRTRRLFSPAAVTSAYVRLLHEMVGTSMAAGRGRTRTVEAGAERSARDA